MLKVKEDRRKFLALKKVEDDRQAKLMQNMADNRKKVWEKPKYHGKVGASERGHGGDAGE